tara:strand:- start:702 stop:1145 length:444 start_codon:yes stop_codon:yes gene_type:complete
MITLRPSVEKELNVFANMELQVHANRFVNATNLESHRSSFKNPNIIYLSIENIEGKVSGYFILVVETDTESVEFHRIVIDENCRGIGQAAIREMENYCRSVLSAKRIWLDVYEDNLVGKHIYEKLDYKKFKERKCDGRKLLFYQKAL